MIFCIIAGFIINFIGIEVHSPGVGRLLARAKNNSLTNLRIFHHDAIEVLTHSIQDNSLDTVQVFFPDPWPKKRHYKRRLIQSEFVSLVAQKLKAGGYLHCATDWEHYAEQMMRVLSTSCLINVQGEGKYYLEPYRLRPITKFEQRGLKLKHQIWDLVFRK